MKRLVCTAFAAFWVAFVISGCGGTDDDDDSDLDPCGIAGSWSMSYTVGGGDCFDAGGTFTDTYTFTLVGTKFTVQNDEGDLPDAGTLDHARCSMVLQYTETVPETATTYEVRGAYTETLTFSNTSVSSAISISADLYESGSKADTCTQSVTGTGSKK